MVIPFKTLLCQHRNLINLNSYFLQRVLDEPGEYLSGSLGIVHQYVKMSDEAVNPYDPVSETFNTVSFDFLYPFYILCKNPNTFNNIYSLTSINLF